MPNFKDDKSKFTMKNMNYYKGKHAAGEAGSPYNKNGGKLGKAFAKSFSEIATERMIRNMGGMFGKSLSRFGGKTNTADLKNQIAYKETSPETTEETGPATYKAGKTVAKSLASMAEQLATGQISLKKEAIKIPKIGMKKEVKQRFAPNTGYTPQTKSRKDPSTDVTPQSQKGKKQLMFKQEVRKVKKK